MTDWSYQVGAVVERGRKYRSDACLALGLYPNAGRFVRALGAKAAGSGGPVTHWGVQTGARPTVGPLLPGTARVALERSISLDVEVISPSGTSQIITRAGVMRGGWAVISHIQAGEWTVPLDEAWGRWLDELGLIEITDLDAIDAALAQEPPAPDLAALEDEITTAIDAYLTSAGLVGDDRDGILSLLGTGRAAARALLMEGT